MNDTAVLEGSSKLACPVTASGWMVSSAGGVAVGVSLVGTCVSQKKVSLQQGHHVGLRVRPDTCAARVER